MVKSVVPPTQAESECIPELEMECMCSHGVVKEPCRFCVTCAKGPGEICGGPYGAIGECAKGLQCTARREEYLTGQNVTGHCEGARGK